MDSEDKDRLKSNLIYFLAGAGLGAVVALLFAPKAGHELRGDIADGTRRSINYVNENARYVGEQANNIYQTGRDKASDLLESGKGAIWDQKEKVAAAIDAGKKAYQDKKADAASAATSE